MRTLTGDCTSSEDVAEAWSLSPSDPIFKSSCTISGGGDKGRAGQVESGAPGYPLPDGIYSLIIQVCAGTPRADWSPSGRRWQGPGRFRQVRIG